MAETSELVLIGAALPRADGEPFFGSSARVELSRRSAARVRRRRGIGRARRAAWRRVFFEAEERGAY